MSHLMPVLRKRDVREADRGHFPAAASRSLWVGFPVQLGFFAFSLGQTLIMHSCVSYMTHVIRYYINIVCKHRVLGCMRWSLAPYLSERHKCLTSVHEVRIPVTVSHFQHIFVFPGLSFFLSSSEL